MAADLSALGEQMLRLARAGIPSSEKAAAELVTPKECFGWLVEAARLFSEESFNETRRALRNIVGRRSAAQARTLPATVPQFMPYVGENRPAYFQPYLPRAADEYFAAYVERVAGMTGALDFGFQVPDLQAVHWDAFGRFLQIITPILVDLGPRRSRFNCFFGNYRRTPFGAHFDAHHLHSFQYVVQGRKRLRAWNSAELVRRFGEASMVELYRSAPNERRALPATPVIAAGPGELLYWPGLYTHCLESDGPSIGMSIVIESTPLRLWDLSRSHLRHLGEREPAGRARRSPPRRAGAERHLARIARQLRSRSTATAILHELVLDASGRAVAPAPAKSRAKRIKVTDVLESRLTPAFRILHLVEKTRLVVAVNGHASEWTDARSTADVVRLLSFLNRTRRFGVRDVVARFVRPRRFVRGDVLDLLGFFVSVGAFRVRPTAAGATSE